MTFPSRAARGVFGAPSNLRYERGVIGTLADRRPGARPPVAVALAAILGVLAAPLLGTAHLTAVQHVVCPRDGELVEVHSGGITAGRASRAAALPAIASAESQSAESGHGRDHCSFATHSLPRSTAMSDGAVSTVGPGTGFASVGCDASAARLAVDVYRFAPKSSPPTA